MMEVEIFKDEYLPLRDTVFQYLRKCILTGEMKPGDRLLEIKLAEKLGVSRTPIREAIRKLELEGLVNIVPRKGAEVANITSKSLSDVLEVRRALEGLAVELACVRANDEMLKNIYDKLHEFDEALNTEDLTKISRADEAYHDAIIRATENTKLADLVANLREQMYRYRFEYIKDTEAHDKIREEHHKIYTYIKNHQVQEAGATMREHIDNQEVSILKILDKRRLV